MTFRFARHTNDLDSIAAFYTSVLGLEVLGNFKDHNGYDGIFIGLKIADWHLEFTRSDSLAEHQFDEDDMLVFYPDTTNQYQDILNRIERNKIELATPKNPYWQTNGKLILDPDGYRIMVSPLRIRDK